MYVLANNNLIKFSVDVAQKRNSLFTFFVNPIFDAFRVETFRLIYSQDEEIRR